MLASIWFSCTLSVSHNTLHDYIFRFTLTHQLLIFLFRPFKKLKVSPRNLYTAAKECNVHKVLALLGELYFCDCNVKIVFWFPCRTKMHWNLPDSIFLSFFNNILSFTFKTKSVQYIYAEQSFVLCRRITDLASCDVIDCIKETAENGFYVGAKTWMIYYVWTTVHSCSFIAL